MEKTVKACFLWLFWRPKKQKIVFSRLIMSNRTYWRPTKRIFKYNIVSAKQSFFHSRFLEDSRKKHRNPCIFDIISERTIPHVWFCTSSNERSELSNKKGVRCRSLRKIFLNFSIFICGFGEKKIILLTEDNWLFAEAYFSLRKLCPMHVFFIGVIFPHHL